MSEQVIQMFSAENLSTISGIHQWGIEVIKVIQRLESPTLTALMTSITNFGAGAFYIPVILVILWWIDESRGLRLGILVIISGWINYVLKDVFRQPRPFNLDASLGLAFESTYGAPSGHAQHSLIFFVPMAAWLAGKWEQKRRFVWAGAAFILLLIAFTRLYLGVHFPTDILAGWAIGGIILSVYFLFGPRLEKLFAAAGIRSQNICVAVLALVMNGLYPKDRMLPALFLGFCLGYTLMKKHFPFSAQGEIKGKKPGPHIMFFRCVTGFAGMVIIFMASQLIFPGEGSLFGNIHIWGEASIFYELGRFIRFGLIGLWVSAGAPRMFQLMTLAVDPKAEKEGGEETPE